MTASLCKVKTDREGRELCAHGDVTFPIACYDEDFSTHPVPWHWHDEFEILILTAGCAHIDLEQCCVPLLAGDALLVHPGALHGARSATAQQARCRSLVFHPRLIGGGIDSVFWQTLIDPLVQNKSLRYQYLDHTIAWQAKAITDMADAWTAFVGEENDRENLIRYLLSRAFRALNQNRPASATTVTRQTWDMAERTKTMMQYIHEHYAEELLLDQIAGSASVSKSVCLRCFRQVIGTTPVRYLAQYRIEKAAGLLRTTDKRTSEIAIACGFSDLSYFTKCFRERKGLTPLAYRRAVASGQGGE